jgi:hypothetical protein
VELGFGHVGLLAGCAVTLLNMLARSGRAGNAVVSMPQREVARAGVCMAWTRLLAAAQAVWREGGFGIGTWEGNHSSLLGGSFRTGAVGKNAVAAIMVGCVANSPTRYAMGGPGFADGRLLVFEELGSKQAKGGLIEIEGPVELWMG